MSNTTETSQDNVTSPPDLIAGFCKKHQIARFYFFGAVLRHDFSADSDLEVLVEFLPGKTPGLHFSAIQDGLTQLFGRRVALHTLESLSSEIRETVEDEAALAYQQR